MSDWLKVRYEVTRGRDTDTDTQILDFPRDKTAESIVREFVNAFTGKGTVTVRWVEAGPYADTLDEEEAKGYEGRTYNFG